MEEWLAVSYKPRPLSLKLIFVHLLLLTLGSKNTLILSGYLTLDRYSKTIIFSLLEMLNPPKHLARQMQAKALPQMPQNDG